MKTILILGVLILAGCTGDPYRWENHWNPNQANMANAVQQAANTRDAVHGHGDSGADGQEAAAAVQRLREGKVKQLTDVSLSGIGDFGGAGGSQGSGAGGTGQ